MKFGDIVRVVELGAADVKHAVGIVEGVVEGLVDVVAFIDGQQRHLQGLPVVSHAQAIDPATASAAQDPRAADDAVKPATAHVAVPIDDDGQGDELTVVATSTPAAAEPAPSGPPSTLQAPTS